MQFKDQPLNLFTKLHFNRFWCVFVLFLMVGGVLELAGDAVNFIQKIIVFCFKVSQEELGFTWLYSSVKSEMSPLAFEERE